MTRTTSWAKYILPQFKMVPKNASRDEFHFAYTKLLSTLFPWNTDYCIFPRVPGSHQSASFHQFWYEVQFNQKPVFLLDLRRPGDLRYSLKRHEADYQIRKRMEALRDECPLPVLHAVSAFGTRLRFYKMHHNQSIEPLIPAHPERVTETASRNCWDSDILEKEGEKRIKSVVKEINRAHATLCESHQLETPSVPT
ncbi:hypothetical protein EDB84DRAFT_132925 [Lactarius hengduanensis]|nr:hypothetical protein EDB84DRAFT_132925 [Lactarius hengduanensis]